MMVKITRKDRNLVATLVKHFVANKDLFDRLAKNLANLLTDNNHLPKLIHSVKWRVKEPSHLEDKLVRKIEKCREEQRPFDINATNLFEKLNDLAGVRLLHLHTTQIGDIDKEIKRLLEHERYSIVEGPFARTWDDEYRDYFKGIGFSTEQSQSLYTSVHYVVQPNHKTKYTAEIQVRTLAEELWGEVAHSVDYPHPTESVACKEQIKVLARVTSSCTRLVDSIYKSREEHAKLKPG
jgi:putative GTP pyrophosphokinase